MDSYVHFLITVCKLQIYSENQSNIRKTKADIDEECQQEKQEVIINSTKDQDVIKLLKQTQVFSSSLVKPAKE